MTIYGVYYVDDGGIKNAHSCKEEALSEMLMNYCKEHDIDPHIVNNVFNIIRKAIECGHNEDNSVEFFSYERTHLLGRNKYIVRSRFENGFEGYNEFDNYCEALENFIFQVYGKLHTDISLEFRSIIADLFVDGSIEDYSFITEINLT